MLALCLISATLSAVICAYADPLGRAFGLIDHPDGSLKRHVEGVPLIGGLALLVPSLSISLYYFTQLNTAPYMLIVIAATAATMVLGIIDDKIGLSARIRFIALAVIVFVLLLLDPLSILNAFRFGIPDFDIRIPLGIFAAPLTALIILGFVNAANLSDGMNGQLLGSLLIWSLFLSRYLGFDSGLPFGVPFLAFVFSALVVLAYNLQGRLFSGSAGAYGASLFIALCTIAAYRRGGALSAVEPVLWFWLPVLDCVRVMIGRALRGTSPFFGDRTHFHHYLQDVVGTRYALFVYLFLLAAPGTAAALTSGRLEGLLVLLGAIAFYGVFVLRHQRQTARGDEVCDTPTPVRSLSGAAKYQARSSGLSEQNQEHLARPTKINP